MVKSIILILSQPTTEPPIIVSLINSEAVYTFPQTVVEPHADIL